MFDCEHLCDKILIFWVLGWLTLSECDGMLMPTIQVRDRSFITSPGGGGFSENVVNKNLNPW